MATWGDFKETRPELAAHGERLIKQHGIGLGFIATIRKDGGPRLHPCCPALSDSALYVFVVETSPKLQDLLRDPRYALHAFPAEQDEEFYVAGRARRMDDDATRYTAAQAAQIGSHRVGDHFEAPADEVLFELSIERALHTTWENWAKPGTRPIYTKWNEEKD
ncbi:MAG TPA: pyridoxamine 5'-phosphate oxidase family protein [Dehalococcoidia bacterium]|nr:pyridoxamine 5'-phosphate oxidase family protein [Dehalococcoidia bacterium]